MKRFKVKFARAVFPTFPEKNFKKLEKAIDYATKCLKISSTQVAFIHDLKEEVEDIHLAFEIPYSDEPVAISPFAMPDTPLKEYLIAVGKDAILKRFLKTKKNDN